MSFWKEKKQPRLRECHIKLSPKCQKIFRTKYKVSGKRTVCKACRIYLNKIGINVWRYFKMNEPEEKFEWINKDEIRATIKKEIEIKNDKNKTIGTKKEEYVQMTTIKEMKEGIESIKENLNKNKKQVKIFQRQLDSLGKIPGKSNEMIRLERNLTDLGKIARINELKKKIEPLEKEISENEVILQKRLEFLKK